jgi:hypothetical protein
VTYPLAFYLPYLALTLAVEVPVVAGLLWRRVPFWRSVLAALLASGTTNPLLWYAWPLVISPHQYVLYAATGETLVVLIETLILFAVATRPRWALALLVSLASNAASFGVGMLIYWLR